MTNRIREDHPAGRRHHHRGLQESYAHVRGGPPVLDIGGDIGALAVSMPDSAAGTELHLRSADIPPLHVHTGVWRRGSEYDAVTTAVFAELPEGTYWILDDDETAIREVNVRGGELATADLRTR